MQDRELIQGWRGFLSLLFAAESIYLDEGEWPPPFLRRIAIAEFCKAHGIPRYRVDAALQAWECDEPNTLH